MKPMNLLIIMADELSVRTLGCYGHPMVQTPNIDRLAAGGTVFGRAYCQQAVCNPSRASVMTGLRPDSIRVWDLKSHFRSELSPELATLPQFTTGTHFREARPEVSTLPQAGPACVRGRRVVHSR